MIPRLLAPRAPPRAVPLRYRFSRLLSILIEGFAASPRRCACGRLHHIGVSADTKTLILSLWAELLALGYAPPLTRAARVFLSRWEALEPF